MSVYENVVKKIKEQNLTINKVESGAGVANGTIAGWKNGSKPYLETVAKIANLLSCTVDELITKED